MKRCFHMLAAAFCGVTPAVAADLNPYVKTPLPPFTWTGFYFGPQAGFGWGTPQNVAGINMTGGFVGGQGGYNFQTANLVLGVEADIASAYIDKTIYGTSFTINVPATVRARFGVAMNNLLLYGTAGGAIGHVEVGETVAGVAMNGSNWQTGWAAGAGIEWAFVPNWSAKLEYMHYDLGSATYFSTITTGNINVDTVKIGLNYLLH